MKHLLTLITLSLLAVTGFAKKPNFVIIMTDDQGYNDLSCYGSKKIKTPQHNVSAISHEHAGNPLPC